QAISGLGGIGKTQVALEYAYRYREHYHDILWVSAESQETLMASYAEIARCLRLSQRDEPDQSKIVEAVKHWLREHKDWLLVLDNLEDLSLLPRLLPVDRQGAVLLTTRRQVTEPMAQAVELDTLSPEEGTLFLLRRCKRLDLHASLEQAQASEVSVARAITEHLGGLPLALDQAGAYIVETGCELSVYLTLLHQRQHALLERRGSIPTQHPASVTTTLTLAFEQVQQRNQAAMHLLTLCAFLAPDDIAEELFLQGGSVLEPRLQSVITDPLVFHAAIEVLRSLSLVQRHPQTHALSVHRLVQAVLQERLPEPERQQWQQRAIHLLHALFPWPTPQTGKTCTRLLPHVLMCATNTSEYIEDLQLARLLFFAAIHLREEAHYEQAEPLLKRVLHIRERLLGPQHPKVADALCALGMLYRLKGQFEPARSLFERALQMWEQIGGPRHTQVGYTLHGLGLIYWQQGQYQQAQDAFERALSILQESFGPQHPEVAHPLSNLGLLYSQQGHYEQARPLLERSLVIRQQALGQEHLEVAYSLSALGQLCLELGQFGQAHSYFEQALCIWEGTFGPQHPQVAMTLSHLGQLSGRQSQFEQADRFLRQALRIWEQTLGPEHPYVANALHELANLSRDQGHFEQAEALYQRALALRELLDPEHPDLADSWHDLARLHELQQHPAEALTGYQQALTIRQHVLGQEHPKTQETRSALIHLSQQTRQTQEASSVEALTLEPECISLCACGCGRPIDTSKSRGEPRRFFSSACKQRFYRHASRQKRNADTVL
ncbi:MAG TPA: tetratricopeptide repeat protein, partial [Ktedonobacteraceae bacterium]|nr:tetratricopeptide repeat protein [Ktedonobacteraceae bacterium]